MSVRPDDPARENDDTRPTFFIDRSLGGEMIRIALQSAGAIVRVHDDHFKPDEADAIWLAEAGRRKWVVLTKDRRIRKRILERRALKAAAVHAFFLGNGCSQGSDMADAYVRALPGMLRTIERASEPVWMTVHRDGHLTKLPQDDVDDERAEKGDEDEPLLDL